MALFIVVLLNINSYAAVGANDGSAFVTKAEFDALVNTFNEQMDGYQSGLNSKIDGAIANYLAGLSSETTIGLTDYLKAAYENNVNNVSFYRFKDKSWKAAQEAHDIKFLLYYAYSTGASNIAIDETSTGYHGWVVAKNDSTWTRGDYVKYPYGASDDDTTYHDYKYWIRLHDKKSPSTGFYFEDYDLHRCTMKASSEGSYFGSTSIDEAPGYWKPSQITTNLVMDQAGNIDGGTITMANLSVQATNWLGHEWKDPSTSYYTKGSQEFLKYMGADYTDSTNERIIGINYEDRNTYDGTATTIDQMGNEPPSTAESGGKPGTNVTWYYGQKRVDSVKSNNNFQFKITYKKQKSYNYYFSYYLSNYWSTILGTPHKNNAGAVLTNVKTTGKIKYTFKLDKRADVTFMDIPFPNSAIPEKSEYTVGGKTYDHVLGRVEAVKADVDTEVELEKKIINNKTDGDYIYVKVYPLESADVSVIQTVVSPVLKIEDQ